MKTIRRVLSILLLGVVPASLASLVNVTIDNKLGDPITGVQFSYQPNGAWLDGPGCSTCASQPDPTLAYDGTWADGTFNPLPGSNPYPNTVLTASVNFTGTALYVYCIMTDSNTVPDGTTTMLFYIDGNIVGAFNRTPPGTPDYEYNFLVYSNTSLPPGTHNFTLQNGILGGPKSLALLDYVTYTSSVPSSSAPSSQPSSSSSSSNTLASISTRTKLIGIVLGVLAALSVICIAILLLLCLARKRSRRSLNTSTNKRPTPTITSSLSSLKTFGGLWVRDRGRRRPETVNFDSDRFVRRTVPVPQPQESTPYIPVMRHPYAAAPVSTRPMSEYDSTWSDTPLEPQRRLPTPPLPITKPGQVKPKPVLLEMADPPPKSPGVLLDPWKPTLPIFDPSEVDLSNHLDESSDSFRSPAPNTTPNTASREPRRFTVRNR